MKKKCTEINVAANIKYICFSHIASYHLVINISIRLVEINICQQIFVKSGMHCTSIGAVLQIG